MTSGSVQKSATAGPVKVVDMLDGETVNLSERGVYFKSAQKVKIGQSVELYFTIPGELTGRSPEPVNALRAWSTWNGKQTTRDGREWARRWKDSSRCSDFAGTIDVRTVAFAGGRKSHNEGKRRRGYLLAKCFGASPRWYLIRNPPPGKLRRYFDPCAPTVNVVLDTVVLLKRSETCTAIVCSPGASPLSKIR
jgi:hypothetical protein